MMRLFSKKEKTTKEQIDSLIKERDSLIQKEASLKTAHLQEYTANIPKTRELNALMREIQTKQSYILSALQANKNHALTADEKITLEQATVLVNKQKTLHQKETHLMAEIQDCATLISNKTREIRNLQFNDHEELEDNLKKLLRSERNDQSHKLRCVTDRYNNNIVIYLDWMPLSNQEDLPGEKPDSNNNAKKNESVLDAENIILEQLDKIPNLNNINFEKKTYSTDSTIRTCVVLDNNTVTQLIEHLSTLQLDDKLETIQKDEDREHNRKGKMRAK